jgi:hypothetical protein
MPNLSDEKEADETVTEIVDNLKSEIEAQMKMRFTLFRPIAYRTQTVRGTNFYVKLKIAGVDASSQADAQQLAASNNQPIKFIHVRIWRDLPVHNFKLTLYDKVEINKLESDPIDYFE